MYDIAIIGAGIIGTSIARELSRYELCVGIFEKENDVSMGATKANSAIVHGGFAESHEKLKGRLCYQGRKQFDQLDKELNFGFEKIGSLVLAFDEEQHQTLKNIHANGIANGLDDLKIIDHDAIMALEPNVNPEVKYALHCQGAGICSPYEMAIAMAENAIANGVKLFLNTEIIAIDQSNQGFELVDNNGETQCAKYLINAGGLNSDKISKMLGIDYFTINPRTGEYILMVRGSGNLINSVLFQMPTKMGKGILVTPTYHGNLLIGPDAVNDDIEDKSTHAKRLLKIFNEAKHTTSKLNIKQFIKSFTGVRAVSSTDDFIIEATGVKGFIHCAGIQSPGLTSSPAITKMVVDLLEKEGCPLKINPKFNPYRPAIIQRKELLPLKEIMPLIAIDSAPEKIICRCEQVTEATIIDAMNRGIPVTTIDGIKRRTRAGMGWCQGTFCRPRVEAVMQKELGREINAASDVEHSGVNRVEKNEIVDYIEKHQ